NRLHRKLLLERIGGLAKRKAPRDSLEIIRPSLAFKSGDSDFLWPGLFALLFAHQKVAKCQSK
ncbi:MAG: hypothetical protein CMP59_02055, partial [Flavobacteriales bacterium]|nr:hypothetical protein [Flavobacteriales bacterium]